ncbi:BACON domain-containing protein [Mangrovibacterium marinum]|uniref:BACON domain-containing protein n=1 Tax=Mangrovibacterium marinum TaxID=1639118 RepID=A0A2T5C659_9BACT|nr:BACON domain-containing protein [Mangrovibacterium marinum]PTN10417.1 hypothetical protein C8N47_10165 [Mangrovibacterium marinum]
MKLLFKIACCLCVGFYLITACNDDNELAVSGFSLGTKEITLGATGGAETVRVASATQWTAKADQPWVKVIPANGVGEIDCEIVVDTTLTNELRNAVVTFIPENQGRQDLLVHQTGYGKVIGLNEPTQEIANMGKYGERFFDLSVTTNVAFKVLIPEEAQEWISLDEEPSLSFDKGARPQTTKLRFNWKMNTTPQERIAAIEFLPLNEDDVLEDEAVLTVTQQAAPEIEDNRAGDSLAMVIIKEKLQSMISWDMNEKIDFWNGVTLWEKTDEGVQPEWVGRVRGLDIRLFNTKESLPDELGKLTYLETLVLYGNSNRHLLPETLYMGTALANLEHLKHLTISSYGITTIDPSTELTKPKETLESLNLRGNNFTSLPYAISSYNFPKLTSLNLGGMRRYDTRKDLRDDVWQTSWGMRIDASSLTSLFRWDALKHLSLSYGYIYGELPEMKGWSARYYTAEQIAANDTLNSASPENKQRLMTEIPCVLPNLESLNLNLNFLTGKLPDWLLYHPRLTLFDPYTLVFTQENGYDRQGQVPGFTNEPDDLDYYYEFYPAAKPQITE